MADSPSIRPWVRCSGVYAEARDTESLPALLATVSAKQTLTIEQALALRLAIESPPCVAWCVYDDAVFLDGVRVSLAPSSAGEALAASGFKTNREVAVGVTSDWYLKRTQT